MTRCPLCNSNDTSLHLKGGVFKIMRCNTCTNAWTDPAPGDINYVELDFHRLEISGTDKSPKTIHSLPKQWRKSIAQQLKLIEKHLPAGSSVLEIGCGEGIFLNELKKLGYKTFGVEPSVTASERANALGLNVIQGYFPNDQLKNKKFDLIIMSHVLEHIEKPVEVFNALKECLTRTGKLLFIQTNYKGLMPALLRQKWYAWLPEQHYWHFTPDGIVNLTRNVGFRELTAEYSSLVHYDKKFSIKNSIMFIIDKVFLLLPEKAKDQFHLILSFSQ